MSSYSGVKIAPEVIEEFTKLKLKKAYKYIILKLSDDLKEVVVETTSSSEDWEEFRNKLLEAKFKTPTGHTKSPRYAIYDLHYETPEGPRTRIIFIAWSPDDAGIKAKMTYASSKDAAKRCLNGVHVEVQANDNDDLEFKTFCDKATRSN
ncbi:Cofilin [Escovopsis weberi]|uniref:Cofilin n=1 Tax=Escovopsis weberi TaxID=150374 RepID=A0A0M8MX63_ESCWE|nr:Cofilin [Escovopsis weberi]